jgi:hypothetical protein
MRVALAIVLLALLPACGHKKAPHAGAGSSKSTTASTAIEIPDDAKSKAFAARLVGLEMKDWSPSDAGVIQLRYVRMSHKADNTWNADAHVSDGDEEVSCQESGTWTMDAAESESTAEVTWFLHKTNCPGRNVQTKSRGQVTITQEGKFKVAMH